MTRPDEKPCFGCASTVRERSACPECGKVLCQSCAESPDFRGYVSCCDAPEDEGLPVKIALARVRVANGSWLKPSTAEAEALLHALDARDLDIEGLTASRDAATTELAHVRVELVAALAERDQALESRDAIASAHGVLVVEVMRLKEQLRELEENNRNLATVIALSSERGQA